MKFTRNDLVTVKTDLIENNLYGMCFASADVMRVRGLNLRIKDIVDSVVYSIYGMDNVFFTDEMLEDDVVAESVSCSKCGKADLEDVIWDTNGQAYCKDCAQDMFVVCSHCGTGLDRLTQSYHTMNDQFYCDTCYAEKFAVCSECGAIHEKGDMYQLENGSWVCSDCISAYTQCKVCGKWSKTATEFDGDMLCPSCMEKYVKNAIKGYHEFQNWETKTTDSTDVLENNLIGFELEVERGGASLQPNVLAYMATKKTDNLIVCERDGSLNNGFEMISHPMTMDYVRTVASEKFQNTWKYLSDLGVRSHDTSTCGLHFHVNREDLVTPSRSHDNVVDNILLIVETFRKEIERFARRSDNSYAKFMTSGANVYMKTVKKRKEDTDGDRYQAVNLCKDRTVEFRMFKGTLKFETFMASMELVNNIVNLAKHSEVNGLTWKDVINYNSDKNQYIVAYNEGLNIESTKKLTVLSPFEEKRDVFTIDNFLKDEFAIKMNYTRRDFAYVLAGILIGKGVKFPTGQFANMMNAVVNHYDNTRVVHVAKVGRDYVLRRVNGTHEMTVDLSDIIELWNENTGA